MIATPGTVSRQRAQHLAVELDRVEPLHPLQHLVAAGLRRHVQVLHTFGRSRTASSRSSVMSLGKLVMNLMRSMPGDVVDARRAGRTAASGGRRRGRTGSC